MTPRLSLGIEKAPAPASKHTHKPTQMLPPFPRLRKRRGGQQEAGSQSRIPPHPRRKQRTKTKGGGPKQPAPRACAPPPPIPHFALHKQSRHPTAAAQGGSEGRSAAAASNMTCPFPCVLSLLPLLLVLLPSPRRGCPSFKMQVASVPELLLLDSLPKRRGQVLFFV